MNFFFLKIIIDVIVGFVNYVTINETFGPLEVFIVQMSRMFLVIFFVDNYLLLNFSFLVPKYYTIGITVF